MSLILAIDLSAIYFRNWVGGGVDTPVTQAKQNTIDTVRRIEAQFPSDTVSVICCDSKSNWRKKLDTEYKANREKQPDAFYAELSKTKDRFVKDGYNVIEAEGYEADDVIASLCRSLGDSPHHVLICSPDKDLLQLVGPTVKQLRTHEMFLPDGNSLKIWDDAMVLDKFGVMPSRLGDWLAITGDKTDNVTGIEGIGGKGAAAIIGEFGTLNTLFSVVEACEPNSVSPFQGRKIISRWEKPLSEFFLVNTKENIDKLSRSRILVSLKGDVKIDIEELFTTKKVQSIVQDKQIHAMPSVSLPPEVEATVDDPRQPHGEPTMDLVKVDPLSEFDKQLQPTGMHGLWWWLCNAVDSRIYSKFGTPERALMAVERGRDYGLSRSAALELLQIVEGRVCPPAQVLAAMALRHPDCLYFYVKDDSNTSATAVTCRKRSDGKEGPEQTFTYTVDMAKQAGLVKKDGAWEKNPNAMCVARAMSWLARRAYPDATTGAYSWEEMEGVQ